MKTLCIYHSRDLDGWMSAAIVMQWFYEKHFESRDPSLTEYAKILMADDYDIAGMVKGDELLQLLGWDYGDDIPDMSDYDSVIMVDVSFSVGIMAAITKRLNTSFVWIDHHKSAIDAVQKGEWPEGTRYSLQGKQDVNFAACELTWQYFFPDEAMPELVRLLGRYDCFGHKNTPEELRVLQFQYAARTYIKNPKDAFFYLVMDEAEYLTDWGKIGIGIYDYLCTEAKQTYAKAFSVTFNEDGFPDGYDIPRVFLAVNQERFNPINFGIDYHKDNYDGFACFWFNNGKWTWSLYNDNGNVDCSKICKGFGGGGHKGAAGFVQTTEEFIKLLNQ